MATWSAEQTGTLKIKSANDANKTFSLVGVNTDNSAGSPDVFLAASNRLLAVVGEEGILRGMKRSLSQEVID